MNSDDKFNYFMDRTEKDLDHIKERVDKLWSFRMMLLGGSVVLSILASIAINLLMILTGGKA